MGVEFDGATYGAVQSHTTDGSRQSIDLRKVWKPSDESLDGQKPSMWWNTHDIIISSRSIDSKICAHTNGYQVCVSCNVHQRDTFENNASYRVVAHVLGRLGVGAECRRVDRADQRRERRVQRPVRVARDLLVLGFEFGARRRGEEVLVPTVAVRSALHAADGALPAKRDGKKVE